MAKDKKPYNNGRWTVARFNSFISSALRQASRKWPPRFEVLTQAKTEKKINKKTKRLSQHYLCQACGEEFPTSDVQVDHIVPVVDPNKGFQTWDIYIERLFCEQDNLQVLCTECHKEKTLGENRGSK